MVTVRCAQGYRGLKVFASSTVVVVVEMCARELFLALYWSPTLGRGILREPWLSMGTELLSVGPFQTS